LKLLVYFLEHIQRTTDYALAFERATMLVLVIFTAAAVSAATSLSVGAPVVYVWSLAEPSCERRRQECAKLFATVNWAGA
jgi:hypothetical protein